MGGREKSEFKQIYILESRQFACKIQLLSICHSLVGTLFMWVISFSRQSCEVRGMDFIGGKISRQICSLSKWYLPGQSLSAAEGPLSSRPSLKILKRFPPGCCGGAYFSLIFFFQYKLILVIRGKNRRISGWTTHTCSPDTPEFVIQKSQSLSFYLYTCSFISKSYPVFLQQCLQYLCFHLLPHYPSHSVSLPLTLGFLQSYSFLLLVLHPTCKGNTDHL